jgi:hypothetical protein
MFEEYGASTCKQLENPVYSRLLGGANYDEEKRVERDAERCGDPHQPRNGTRHDFSETLVMKISRCFLNAARL